MVRATDGFVDLHVHTWHSDATLSPAQVVAQAVENGVTLLAITDHELFDGSVEAAPLCRAAGIRLIPGIEMACQQYDVQCHVLSLGGDIDDEALRKTAAHGRKLLDDMSVWLFERMWADYPQISPEDFAAFPWDRTLGGWRGLQYLYARGASDTLKGGMKFYKQYGIDYSDAGFPDMPALLSAIHGAGARAVLAHARHSMRDLDDETYHRRLTAMLDLGLDGVECYYPLHDPPTAQALVDICRARGLMITAGSDCHGAFGKTRVGEMNIRADQIDLRGL